MQMESSQLDSGFVLRDLLTDSEFPSRAAKTRNANRESMALRRLSRLFAEKPESVLQELVNTAVEFCGAESAGISLEEPDDGTFRWIVVAGSFAQYLGGRTPRHYSPCGTCLDSGRPQLYRVTKPYYDYLGVTAAPIIDGMLIPWSNEFMRGTLWAVSHASAEAFSSEDYELLTVSRISPQSFCVISIKKNCCERVNAQRASQRWRISWLTGSTTHCRA
jgi:hypothetical protein